jgi:hypothetical protein
LLALWLLGCEALPSREKREKEHEKREKEPTLGFALFGAMQYRTPSRLATISFGFFRVSCAVFRVFRVKQLLLSVEIAIDRLLSPGRAHWPYPTRGAA